VHFNDGAIDVDEYRAVGSQEQGSAVGEKLLSASLPVDARLRVCGKRVERVRR
jgi:hypothetical protein